MLIVACKCLNIKASISSGEEADRSICTPVESMPDYECIGPFRNPTDLLIEIKHDELTQSCRAQATAPRTWTLISCLICNQIVCGSRRAVTEASSGEGESSVPFEVVLNRKLLTSAEAISKMKLDVHFSKTFKVVIRPSSSVQSPPRSPTDLLNSTDPRLKKLSAVLSERLRRETERTEDIIRQFTRDQFLNLSALRQEAESEFVKLAQTATVAPSSHDQEMSRYDINKLMSVSVVGGNLLETPPLTPDSGLMSSPPELHSHNPPRSSLVSSKSCEEDFFDMEDLFPGADEESPLSDGEPEEDDDDFNPRGRRHEEALEATEALQNGRYVIPQPASRMASDAMMLAKSLPIPTPAMQERMRRDGPTIEESDLDIGNSIMALAKSVHGSDAIFGDLPRPRVCLKDHTTA